MRKWLTWSFPCKVPLEGSGTASRDQLYRKSLLASKVILICTTYSRSHCSLRFSFQSSARSLSFPRIRMNQSNSLPSPTRWLLDRSLHFLLHCWASSPYFANYESAWGTERIKFSIKLKKRSFVYAEIGLSRIAVVRTEGGGGFDGQS